MFEGFIVKILKAESPFLWYADQIGKEFVALPDHQNGSLEYQVVNVYTDAILIPSKRWIRMNDAEVVRKEKFSILYTSRIIPK
jgi:homoserine trans-succinylase